MPQTFPAFFKKATDKSPYPYQRQLACGEDAPAEVSGTPSQSLLIDIPTGLGKTAVQSSKTTT